jgi:HSP20 family molecular chaperone IbpA
MSTTAVEKSKTRPVQAESTRSGPTFMPNVDILETPEELLLIADIPGVDPKDIQLDFERGVLTLQARVRPTPYSESASVLLREYEVGDFRRVFEISEEIDDGKIVAEVKHGVLTLHLPKSEKMKVRKIPIKSV